MTQLLILINIFLTLSTLAISDTATLVVSDIPTWPETSFATLLPRPTQGEVLTPGSTYTISWTPPVGTAVNIEINDGFPPSHGSAHVFGPVCGGWVINYHCGQIAKKAPNSGTYEWVIPVPGTGGSFDPGFQTDPKYMIWIFVWALVVDDKPQGPFYYYSGNFSFKRVRTARWRVICGFVPFPSGAMLMFRLLFSLHLYRCLCR